VFRCVKEKKLTKLNGNIFKVQESRCVMFYSEISFPLFCVNEATQAAWLTADISIYFSILRAATEYYFEVAVCTVHLFIKQKIKKE